MAQKKAAMSARTFESLLKAAGLNHTTAAGRLGVTRRTVIRWAKGHTPINDRTAFYIRTKLSA